MNGASILNPYRKIENFIRTKYESKRWVMDGPMPDPSTLDVDGDDDVVGILFLNPYTSLTWLATESGSGEGEARTINLSTSGLNTKPSHRSHTSPTKCRLVWR
jgi:hypothetical protein